MMAESYSLVHFTFFSMLLAQSMAYIPIDSNWYDAHATFYGDMQGGETMRKYQTKLPLFSF